MNSQSRITLNNIFIGDASYYIKEIKERERYIFILDKQAIKTKWGKTTYVKLENTPIMNRVQIHKVASDNIDKRILNMMTNKLKYVIQLNF